MLRIKFANKYGESEILLEKIRAIFSGDEESIVPINSSVYAKVVKFKVSEADSSGLSKDFYYKEFTPRNWRDFIYLPFRGSRASRAYNGAKLLIETGLCAVESVCIGEQLFIGVIRRSFIVTAAIDDALGVESIIKNFLTDKGRRDGLRDKRNFLLQFGGTIGQMHHHGIVHGDLRIGNILVKQNYKNEICFLDNERNRRYLRIPARQRLKNLVQVNMFLSSYITRTDRLRFWTSYLDMNPELKSQERKWLRKILHKTRQRLDAKGWL